jgi:hypothetical protein
VSNDNALAVIKKAREDGKSLVYVDQNFAPQTELYQVKATVVELTKDDTHNISGKLMPKREKVDQIGEAAGVSFFDIAGATETRDDPIAGKRTVYIGRAQGKIRNSDGSWRTSSLQEYDLDPVVRAMMDKKVNKLDEQTMKIVGQAILEYTKFGRQRAQTGARLRVIRELTGMPTALTAEQAAKPMVFGRIVQNTAFILNTKEGRALATAQALGMDLAALYGKTDQLGLADETPQERDVTPATDDDETGEGTMNEHMAKTLAAQAAEDDPEPEHTELNEFQKLTEALQDYLDGYSDMLNVTANTGVNPFKLGVKELDDMNASVESRKSMITRLKNYLTQKGANV